MSQFIYKNDGKQETLVATGDLGDVCANIGYIIHRIHDGLKKNAPEAAKAFRTAVVQMVTDPDAGIWEDAKENPGEVLISHVQNVKEE